MKTCTQCKQTLPVEDYYRSKASRDGRTARCKACTYKPQTPPLNSTVPCANCGTLYTKSAQHRRYCSVSCRNQANLERRRESYTSKRVPPTPEQLLERKNRRNARARIRYKQLRDANPELYRERDRLAKRKRRSQDPHYRFRSNIGTLIANTLSRSGNRKSGRTESILGCTMREFELWIESQFTQGMRWDNRDEWDIDHIVPVSFGATEREILQLNHYTNLRPLWRGANASKHGSLTPEALEHPLYREILRNR